MLLINVNIQFHHIQERSYVQPICSASRSSLMTGVYPYKLGTQVRMIEMDTYYYESK